MAFVLKDRVRETTAVIGTGPATLLGATGGFQSFGNAMSVGDTCWYGIVHLGVAWETGIGTYSGTNTLTRTTVVESSNSNAAVSFAAGNKDVFISALASKTVTLDQAQTVTGVKTFTTSPFAPTPTVGDNSTKIATTAFVQASAGSGPIFSFEGDSLTNVGNVGVWPLTLKELSGFFNRGTSNYYAASGETAATMVGEYASQAGSVTIASGQEAYYFLWAGTNDLTAGTAAATIYGYLTTMWAAARTTGYKVCAFTIMRRGDLTSGQNDVRIALNALILSDPTLYDYIVRPDVTFTNTADTVNFQSDAIHLTTTTGNSRLAQKVIGAVLGLPSHPAAPFDALAYNGIQVNGGCEVSQEFVTGAKSITATTNVYVADNWQVSAAGTSVVSVQQVTDAPPGFNNSLKLTVTTAQASLGVSDFVTFSQRIEGYRTSRLAFGTLNAQPLSIGFWVKAHRTGPYSCAVRNSAGSRFYPMSLTVNTADTWEFKTLTIPGDVTGTWIGNTNGIGLSLFIVAAAGSSFLGAANAWNGSGIFAVTGTTNGVAATSDTFQITGLIVLPGIELPNSDKLPRIMRPYDQELQLCKRYYEKSFLSASAPVQNAGTNTGEYLFPIAVAGAVTQRSPSYPMVQKRAVPTMTAYNPEAANAFIRDATAAANFSTTVFGTPPGENSFRITGTSPAGSAVGNGATFHWTADARL